ncbi:magnesium transporter [Cyclonatronum proteinivorum]|uniref:Magnesium transporter MgtE n=1 Tax=Cyclonatronum proteinivorum TaxID=1457365 RepID=A0A345UN92_9BACT|nr:magnesium transporter [Cyclonatronum proteinivorum]AXJ01944.1 magnesium transporter [Cyclonatronum proteinivorum]
MTLDNSLKTQLMNALKAGETSLLVRLLAELSPAHVAEFILELETQNKVRVFKSLENDAQLQVLRILDEDIEYEILSTQPVSYIYALVEKMPHDKRVDLLKSFPENKRKEIMKELAQTEREDILKLSSYSEGTTGAIMTTDYAVITAEITAEQALEQLRLEAPEKETIYYAYVIDAQRRLIGTVSLRQLITADKQLKISELMSADFVSVFADEPAEKTARMLKEADLLAIPVLDRKSRITGIVTFDDAMQVIEEETSETMFQKAGIAGRSDRDKEREKDLVNSSKLLKGSIWYPIRLRMMFLFVTLAGGFLVGGVIDYFEDVLEAVLVAAVFIPVLMDMGGNVGTQSSTIFARGLALGHIDTSRIFGHIGREVSIGAIMGLALGLIGGIVAWYWQGMPNGIPEIGLAVGIGLAVVVPVATLLGFLLPYILLKLGFDHAPGADPFITTIKDFTGLGLYFYLVATLIGV